MRHDVQPHNVERAEGGGFRHPQHRTRQRVDFFDGVMVLFHDAEHAERDHRANAIGNEVRPILGHHNAFAEHHVTEMRDCVDNPRQRFRGRNNLQQVEVTGGIEKVGSQQVAVEFFVASRAQGGNGNP